ncbi:MAG: hypothetical protein AB7U98_08175 [Candidatus Nitrosocosmicus sp.]|jgi:hypothetical protein
MFNKTKTIPILLPLLVILTISLPQGAVAQNSSSMINCISIEDKTTSVAGSSPSKKLDLGINNETAAGFSNQTDVEKSTGSNRAIFLNNTDISNPGLTVAEGLEKSQLGNKIAGQQNTIMEGGILNNITDICWQN